MSSPRKPWFRKATGWWMVEIGRRQVKLAQGRDRMTDAERKCHLVMAEIAANALVDGDDPTVASNDARSDQNWQHAVDSNQRLDPYDIHLTYQSCFALHLKTK